MLNTVIILEITPKTRKTAKQKQMKNGKNDAATTEDPARKDENGDTLLTVVTENDDSQFEKVLLKHMVSSQVISDIIKEHINYIYSATIENKMDER